MRETTVFFRDDDVGEFGEALRFFVDLMLEHDLPCHYQVVPAYLDDASAAELRRLKASYPALIHLNQHGFCHEREVDGRIAYAEFAGRRGYDDQRRDIARGKAMLEEMLGEAFSPDVFTPPCHKYDGETLRVLADLGFGILSAGVRTDLGSRALYGTGHALSRVELFGQRVSYHGNVLPDGRLAEVSCAIDVHADVDPCGQPILKDLDRLWREFETCRERLDVVGLMTHHQAIDSEERRTALRGFVERLVEAPGIRFAGIAEIAPQRPMHAQGSGA